MKNISTLVLILIVGIADSFGQCTANFSYSVSADTIAFTDSSLVSNAHYYWNFGDGTGSNEKNPVHVFPDNGEYLITHYIKDTLSNCHDAHETWMKVIKPDTFSSYIGLSDTLYYGNGQWTYQMQNLSNPDPWINYRNDGITNDNLGDGVGWGACIFFQRLQAISDDDINGRRIQKEYYKTVPFQFNSKMNYQDCSANFEVIITYEKDSALVTCTAMNSYGIDTFWITGFGNGIPLVGHKISWKYPLHLDWSRNRLWDIQHYKYDARFTCNPHASMKIRINDPYYQYPTGISIFSQPRDTSVVQGGSAQFSISASRGAKFQWYYHDFMSVLFDNANTLGTRTDTLTLLNVLDDIFGLNMYWCRVTDSTGTFHHDSRYAYLEVLVGVKEANKMKVKLFPNPVHDELRLSMPDYAGDLSISIMNLLGTSESVTNAHGSDLRLDVSDLKAGIHFIEIKTATGNARMKFVKE